MDSYEKYFMIFIVAQNLAGISLVIHNINVLILCTFGLITPLHPRIALFSHIAPITSHINSSMLHYALYRLLLAHAVGECILLGVGRDVILLNDFGEELVMIVFSMQ